MPIESGRQIDPRPEQHDNIPIVWVTFDRCRGAANRLALAAQAGPRHSEMIGVCHRWPMVARATQLRPRPTAAELERGLR